MVWARCWPFARRSAASRSRSVLHALVDGLAVGGGQIHAGQAHVDHLDTQALGLPVHVVLDAVHQAAAIGAHDGVARRAGQDVAHHRVGEAGQPLVGESDRSDGLVELERIRDLVSGEGIDLQVLSVGGQKGLDRQVEIEDPLVEVQHVSISGSLK